MALTFGSPAPLGPKVYQHSVEARWIFFWKNNTAFREKGRRGVAYRGTLGAGGVDMKVRKHCYNLRSCASVEFDGGTITAVLRNLLRAANSLVLSTV